MKSSRVVDAVNAAYLRWAAKHPYDLLRRLSYPGRGGRFVPMRKKVDRATQNAFDRRRGSAPDVMAQLMMSENTHYTPEMFRDELAAAELESAGVLRSTSGGRVVPGRAVQTILSTRPKVLTRALSRIAPASNTTVGL